MPSAGIVCAFYNTSLNSNKDGTGASNTSTGVFGVGTITGTNATQVWRGYHRSPIAPTPTVIDPYVFTPVNTTTTSGTFNINSLTYVINLWDVSVSSNFIPGEAVSVYVYTSGTATTYSDTVTFVPTFE
jgi:hypothetical protein